jgi:alkylation response protein AidB-like acyl-CoA dehydrogenase
VGKYVTPLLDGTEFWCQGFSEPDAGSDLAALECRAVDEGDYWVVTGQKLWTSLAQFASRIVLLTRTGSLESRHRGITAMLVDMDWPGVTVKPLHGMNDADEFSETFFDGVRVPKDRLIGELNGGWNVAMSMLRSERGAIFWMLSAWLVSRLDLLASVAALGPTQDEALGHAFTTIAALRARSWTTQHRLMAGTVETPETSIDKILMATAEQELFDLVRSTLDGELEFGDSDAARVWRSEYMYSRAASIYGGTAEIQRNIVADQLLGFRGAR